MELLDGAMLYAISTTFTADSKYIKYLEAKFHPIRIVFLIKQQ